MRIILRAEFVDSSVKEITANAADLISFEKEFDLSVGALQENTKLTHLMWLAWHSEFRRKETKLDFDNWIDTVESVGGSDTDPK